MPEKHSFSIFGCDERLTCEAARPHLSALLDGALSEQDAATLRLHVGSCPTCAREERSLASADRVLRAQKEVEAPLAWNAIEAKLREEGLIDSSRRMPALGATGRRLPLAIPLSLGLAIAAFVALALGSPAVAMAVLGSGFGFAAASAFMDTNLRAASVALLLANAAAAAYVTTKGGPVWAVAVPAAVAFVATCATRKRAA